MRFTVTILSSIFFLMIGDACADAPTQLGDKGFIPLHGPRSNGSGKSLPPLRVEPPHYFPLASKQGFKPLPLTARASMPMPAHASEVPDAPTGKSAVPSVMTDEQARQILSIFAASH